MQAAFKMVLLALAILAVQFYIVQRHMHHAECGSAADNSNRELFFPGLTFCSTGAIALLLLVAYWPHRKSLRLELYMFLIVWIFCFSWLRFAVMGMHFTFS